MGYRVNKNKILIITKSIDGGTGTFALQLLKLRDEFQIELCVLEKPKYRQIHNTNHIHYFRTESYKNYYSVTPGFVLDILREIRWVSYLINKNKPKIVIGADLHAIIIVGFVKIFISRKTSLIYIIQVNLEAVIRRKLSSPLKIPIKIVGRYFFSRADVVVGVSRGVSDSTRRFFSINKKVITIPHGISQSYVEKKSSGKISSINKYMLQSKDKKVISIGRFDEQKDFLTLIKAIKQVKGKLLNVKLLLIGDGIQKMKLQNVVKELDLVDDIYFIGWQNNIYPFLKASDLFVLSSNYEGFGYVLLEAMSQGLPVISTNSPYGPAEILDKGRYGMLVPIGSVDLLAKSILKILTDRSEYKKYSSKSAERIKFYKEKGMLETYRKLVRSLF